MQVSSALFDVGVLIAAMVKMIEKTKTSTAGRRKINTSSKKTQR